MAHCQSCNAALSTKAARKYCSIKCQHDLQFSEKFKRFSDGENDVFQHHVSLRHALAHRDGYKCSSCGITDWNGKVIVLEVEHIDGNSENSTSPNLCLLCPNCHSQTPTYKNRNKGNGRHARRQRYAEGKSY